MLVLTRKENERIVIGPDVEVVIVKVARGKVKLGFNAPSRIPIIRKELRLQTNSDDAVSAARSGIGWGH
jgi:carbon storage regulator